MPKRIQRKRTKGWRMPEGAVYVGRPTKWGNPFSASQYGKELAVKNYRLRIEGLISIGACPLHELRGKDLACFCPAGEMCHADVLLELSNA